MSRWAAHLQPPTRVLRTAPRSSERWSHPQCCVGSDVCLLLSFATAEDLKHLVLGHRLKRGGCVLWEKVGPKQGLMHLNAIL